LGGPTVERHRLEKIGVSHEEYLVTGTPVDTKANAVLKFAFENNTSGTNQTLDFGYELALGESRFGSLGAGLSRTQ
jgi:hypothetical protein